MDTLLNTASAVQELVGSGEFTTMSRNVDEAEHSIEVGQGVAASLAFSPMRDLSDAPAICSQDLPRVSVSYSIKTS